MPTPTYPDAVSTFIGDDEKLVGSPILAITPEEWPGASEFFQKPKVTLITTEWRFGLGKNQAPVAYLSFSTVEPHTHIVLALNVYEPTHLAALHAASKTGYVILTSLIHFKMMPQEKVRISPGDLLALAIDREEIRAFLAEHGPPLRTPQ